MAAMGDFPPECPLDDRDLHFVTTATPTSLLCSPDRSAASPLQRRIRHTRLFPPLTPSLAAQGLPTGTATSATGITTTPTTTTSATSPRIGTSVEAMAPRTVLRANAIQPVASWQPTRLTSSYCVLSAAGVQEDFYTSALSWGTHQMALALEQSLVLFHPSRPRQSSSTVVIAQPPAGTDVYASRAFHTPRRATAVAMSRCREISCFLGTSNGAVELYEGHGDGRLHCTVAFSMPEPPTDYLSSLLCGDGSSSSSNNNAASSRAARALSLLSSSVSSVGCIGTSDRHPWLGAAATAARGLVALDARQTQPVLRFGSDGEWRAERHSTCSTATVSGCADAFPLASSLSRSSATSSCDGSGLSRLQRASAFLRQHDRLCSVSWNATGSLVATGSSGGVVKVWSLSAPQRPLHSFIVDQECTVKAFAFHPERPYELLVGGAAGAAGLRTYDLSSADPILACCGSTAAAVTQAVYDPAGNYAVTCAGAPTDRTAPYSSPLSLSPLQRSPQSVAAAAAAAAAARADINSPSVGSVLDGSPRWRGSSPSHSGVGLSFGPSSAVPLLQDPWDDMDAAAEDGASFLAGIDGLGGAAGGGPSSIAPAHSTPPNTVVLWRCASRCRDNYLREALLREPTKCGEVDSDDLRVEHTNAFEADDDARERVGRNPHSSPTGEWRTGRVNSGVEDDGLSSGEDGWPRSEWLPMTSLPGHRARPLLICAPFAQSPFSGCYASLAAGDDCTIRFWRLFETVSDATHWRHRRQAQQRSATTQEDMDFFTTPVLR
ncbi:hypothetical protein ABB37_05137 [Leptomonas pyrrhocoris]|uniref:Uncharacterized protein n=1 Tax=Leptomonas pyrrhocoris TaxID=157538 RepID=A0A0M9G0X4_LEPPY|nr:hypothetical protein ABB37_05137 [Leptomonas pyrrhocoris]KPA80150.1 hypothetical protein ABB37_05137 [Leptomonas pyrrhocoris]|eukprot:XP_015658589.1 hypothetical protein ABB37_05137 [Leptomonas pyrrhocoris]